MKSTRTLVWIALLLIGTGLVGCTTEEDTGPLPTQPFEVIDSPVIAPDTTSDVVVDMTATPASATNTPQGPQPLPPTWTATATFSIVIPPTLTLAPTVDIGATMLASSPVPEATSNPGCLTFNLDPARTVNTVTLGNSPTLAWTAATGAVLYRVYVYDISGQNQLHEELVETTTITVNPDVFRAAGTYVWTVAPLDPFGIQMCIELGDAINIVRG
ncbi:MAG: hypothetical protein MUE54_08045 [Anaerolineae bacterium]|nr:hypothetical protein [Anaerolineae bacterium]